MEKHVLKAKTRENKNPRMLRRDGFIPATLYGPNSPSQSLQVCRKELSGLPHGSLAHVLELDLDDKTKVNVLIRSIERKIIKNEILNIQFYKVDMNKLVKVNVGLKFSGLAPAVKAGGQLLELFQEVEIECLPGQIPDFLEVDLSRLEKVDDAIHFKDLVIPNYVKILNPGDEVVVKAVSSKVKATAEEASATATPAQS